MDPAVLRWNKAQIIWLTRNNRTGCSSTFWGLYDYDRPVLSVSKRNIKLTIEHSSFGTERTRFLRFVTLQLWWLCHYFRLQLLGYLCAVQSVNHYTVYKRNLQFGYLGYHIISHSCVWMTLFFCRVLQKAKAYPFFFFIFISPYTYSILRS